MSELFYRKWVLSVYDERLFAGQLSQELRSCKPGDIKKEAMKVCEKELNMDDTIILSPFVKKKDQATSFYHAIKNHNAEPFKPLSNFLNDRKIETHLRNVDLLACLLDLRPRPFIPGMHIPPVVELMKIVPEEKPVTAPVPEKPEVITVIPPPQKTPSQKRGKSYMIFAALIFVICLGGGAIWRPWKNHYNGHEGCMIWNDDHYEPVECNSKSTSLQRYPIKRNLVDSFQRITRPDTLTIHSVRKVWYTDYMGRFEVYTHSGPNPLDTSYRVMILTERMFRKHILHISN